MPAGVLADAISGSFGSFDAFKEQFNKAAAAFSVPDGPGL